MYSFKTSRINSAVEHFDWDARLLRFFCFFVGDQQIAESLTIETLVEDSLRFKHSRNGSPVDMIHRAIDRAIRAPEPKTLPGDAILQAVRSLPIAQRTVVVLFRGLGLGLDEVAEIIGSSLSETNRMCADGLLAINRFLMAPKENNGRHCGARTGESQSAKVK
jgi:hypothetical protein